MECGEGRELCRKDCLVEVAVSEVLADGGAGLFHQGLEHTESEQEHLKSQWWFGRMRGSV